MVKTTEKYTEASYAREYTCQFKGNTLVDISPRAERPESSVDLGVRHFECRLTRRKF